VLFATRWPAALIGGGGGLAGGEVEDGEREEAPKGACCIGRGLQTGIKQKHEKTVVELDLPEFPLPECLPRTGGGPGLLQPNFSNLFHVC
jgi:hypothetical protein